MTTNTVDARTVGQIPLTFLDLETTGLDPNVEEIIEIGAMRIEGGKECGIVETFVRPTRTIPPATVRIHGISDLMVAGAPQVGEAIEPLLPLLGGAVLVAHNAPFDCGFLVLALERLGRALPDCLVLDTVALARGLFPRLPNHKLETLCKHFEVTVERAHRALDDVRSLARVFDCMMKVGFSAAGGDPAFSEIVARCGTRFMFTDFASGLPLARAEDRALVRWAIRSGAPLKMSYAPSGGGRSREAVLTLTGQVDGAQCVLQARDAAGTVVEVPVKSIMQIRRG